MENWNLVGFRITVLDHSGTLLGSQILRLLFSGIYFLSCENQKDVRAPSGKVVKWVAKRGDVGVHMALADEGYDMNQVKRGVYGSGRIAYKKDSVNTA